MEKSFKNHDQKNDLSSKKKLIKQPHISVMLNEVLEQLHPIEEGYYVDATFGAGGYSKAILSAHPKSKIICFDKDKSVEKFAKNLEHNYPGRVEFVYSSYDKIGEFLMARNIKAKGIVYDLGVSSMQLDQKERGFSFEKDYLLDMRMDENQEFSAFDVVNTYDENKLANVIYNYGDERKSRSIAKKIVDIRQSDGKITTTRQLAKIVESVVKRTGKIHPATKTFQAIRIEVNDELNQLKHSISNATPHLGISGKMVVVTFHSLEDKIVKKLFSELTSIGESNHTTYFDKSIPLVESMYTENSTLQVKPQFIKLNKKVIKPTREEVLFNVRSRSAKLRAIMRVRYD